MGILAPTMDGNFHLVLLVSYFVCTFNIVQSENVTTQCPTGWVDIKEDCFLFHETKSLTWTEAKLECENEEAFLAEPTDEDQIELLTNFALTLEVQQLWWLGIRNMDQDGRWRLPHSEEYVNITTWAQGSPTRNEMYNICIIMKAEEFFQWSEDDCRNTRAPICQSPKRTGYPKVTVRNDMSDTVTGTVWYRECRHDDFRISPGDTFSHSRGLCLITLIEATNAVNGVNCKDYSSSGTSYSHFHVVRESDNSINCHVYRLAD